MGRSRPLIPCTEKTRELVRAQKRGGESYDSLLQKMIRQYDPEEAPSQPLEQESA